MSLNFRFGVISDLHIGLPHTIQNHPHRFHLVEVSIPALASALDHLQKENLDFLLIPGDLTQHGEPENHAWLGQRLAQLPFPTYVIPGNHDVPVPQSDGYSISWQDFPSYYRASGYEGCEQHYYTCNLLPGLRLIALNSNQFDSDGKQIGWVDPKQLAWLRQVLSEAKEELVFVMIHHNLIEHVPGQARHRVGRRYMLQNAVEVLDVLTPKVKVIFTGHLHVQDIAHRQGIYEITTGSLVSYPHPYRVIQAQTTDVGDTQLQVTSHRIEAVSGWPTLQHSSREWMGDRSLSFMTQFLTYPPLSLPLEEAQAFAPDLRYFWSTIAAGDPVFSFPQFPPALREYFERFSYNHPSHAQHLLLNDNHLELILDSRYT
jgi:3',5'-cyclic AMP phosphodiesterase CpdA